MLAELKFRESCRHAFQDLKIQTVIALYISETVLYVLKKGMYRQNMVHAHNTRNANNFAIPAHRLGLFEKKPSYMGRKLFNRLPQDLKDVSNISAFKLKLDEWLLARSFYSLEEMLNRDYP